MDEHGKKNRVEYEHILFDLFFGWLVGFKKR